jgi:DNA-directed RNA polymerase subunit RPC12/RpoP
VRGIEKLTWGWRSLRKGICALRFRNILVIGLAVGSIAAVSFLLFRSATRRSEYSCAICGRQLHPTVSYHLETVKGEVVTCCPRCGMHEQLEHPGEVQSSRATDLTTRTPIPAESAFYVEGGDIHYCVSAEKPVERLPQGESVRAFDRCLPTLVAFKVRTDAEAYQARHGGQVLDYAQALESARQR